MLDSPSLSDFSWWRMHEVRLPSCWRCAKVYTNIEGVVGLTSLSVSACILTVLIGGILAMVFLGNEASC